MAERGALPDGVLSARLEQQAANRFVRLRDPLGVTSFGINQLVLEAGQRNRIHRHTAQEEVYLVLSGTLTLVIEAERFDFGAGELVRIAPQVRRQLSNRGPERLSLLALGGMTAHQHQGRDAEAFTAWSDGEAGTPQTVPAPSDLSAAELR